MAQPSSRINICSSDRDYEHTTALLFRRGQAFVRSESSHTEYALSGLPRTDGQPTHMRVQLDRHSACSAQVSLDNHLSATTAEEPRAAADDGFVEFGLVMLDRASGPLRALYDNIAFSREYLRQLSC